MALTGPQDTHSNRSMEHPKKQSEERNKKRQLQRHEGGQVQSVMVQKGEPKRQKQQDDSFHGNAPKLRNTNRRNTPLLNEEHPNLGNDSAEIQDVSPR